MKKTDVVIPARNAAGTIIEALTPFTDCRNISRVIIVIDQDTTDNTRDLLLDYQNDYTGKAELAVFQSGMRGKGQVVKEGLKLVNSERVIFCDADVSGISHLRIHQLLKETAGQIILIPAIPLNVAHHVQLSWPWVSGIRSVPTELARSLDLHGYLMETQINRTIGEAGLPTIFYFADNIASPYDINAQRVAEMERDRTWGIENGVFR